MCLANYPYCLYVHREVLIKPEPDNKEISKTNNYRAYMYANQQENINPYPVMLSTPCVSACHMHPRINSLWLCAINAICPHACPPASTACSLFYFIPTVIVN